MPKTRIGEAVGVVIGLIGTGIVMLWPEQKWLGWVFIVLGFAIAGGFLLWTLAQRSAFREFQLSSAEVKSVTTPQQQEILQTGIDFKPHIEVNPIFNQSQSQSQPQSPSPSLVSVDPELACVGCYSVSGIRSTWTNVLGAKSGYGCMVAQPDFYLEGFINSF